MRALILAGAVAVFVLAGSPASGQEAAQETDPVDLVLGGLSPRDRIAQLFVVGLQGPAVGDAERAFFAEYKVGGVYINRDACNIVNGPAYDPSHCGFADGLTTAPEQVQTLAGDLQDASCAATRTTIDETTYCLPMLISVDHEGDDRPITRLLAGFTPIPSAMAIGATFDPQQAENVGCIVGRELAAAGVNMLLGPTLDVLDSPVSGGPGDQGIRSFGGDPRWVGEMGVAYTDGVHSCAEGAVATVAKHFPGHGRSNRRVDYQDIPVVVGKTLSQLTQVDFAPFLTVADGAPGEAGVVDMIMNSHLSYPGVAGCGDGAPITFSASCMATFTSVAGLPAWRDAGGVTIADDLAAGAVRAYSQQRFGTYLQANIVEEALLAGNDLLPLIRLWQSQELGPTIDYLVTRYNADPIVRARVDDAARRVIALKERITGSLEVAESVAAAEFPASAPSQVSSLMARAATFIRPASVDAFRGSLPTPGAGQQILFVECWDDPTCAAPEPRDAELYPPLWPLGTFEEMALEMFPGRTNADAMSTITFADLGDVMQGEEGAARDALESADWIVFGYLEREPARFPGSEVIKDFLGRGPALFDLRDTQIVVLSFASPYHFDAGEFRNIDLFVALYTKIEPALRTSLQILFQDPATLNSVSGGRLPVDYDYEGFVVNDLDEQVAPDPEQSLSLVLEPEEVVAGDEVAVSLGGTLMARNGHRVPNGTGVTFTFTSADETQEELSAVTDDGVATVTFAARQPGDIAITVTSGDLMWESNDPLTVLAENVEAPSESPDSSGNGAPVAWIAAASAVAIAAGAAVAFYVVRRRQTAPEAVPAAMARREPAEATLALLEVDATAHRVLVSGKEMSPPLSRDQFELLAHLNERAGQLCTRQQIIDHIWPEMDASGVSDQAVDSLVHRTRERLRAAGVDRQLIVTVRGQGFRLDL